MTVTVFGRLTRLGLLEFRRGLLDRLGDQQGLFLGEGKILHTALRGQRQHHDVGLVLGPAGRESGDEVSGSRSIVHWLTISSVFSARLLTWRALCPSVSRLRSALGHVGGNFDF